MEAFEWFVLFDQVRKRNRFGDGRSGYPRVPFALNFLPSHAALNLFEDNPSHDASAFVSRLPVANLRISYNKLAEFNPMFVSVRFHSECFYHALNRRPWRECVVANHVGAEVFAGTSTSHFTKAKVAEFTDSRGAFTAEN